MAKCKIQKYNPTITEPPFEFIGVSVGEVDEPEDGSGGMELAFNLMELCRSQGFYFWSYSLSSDPDYKFEILVRN